MPLFIFAGLFYLLALVLFGYMIFSFFYFKGWKNPPYVPSVGKTKKTIISEASKFLLHSKKKLNVADLGCGDGSLLLKFCAKFPQHFFYGYEWDALPYTIAKRRLKKYKNVQIIRSDLMKTNLQHLDIIICYLGHIPGLGNRLKKTLNPSVIVISEIFEIDGWVPQKIVKSRLFGFESKIFIYRVGDQKFHRH